LIKVIIIIGGQFDQKRGKLIIINLKLKTYNKNLKTKLEDSVSLRLPRVLLPPTKTPTPPVLAKRPSWSSMAINPVTR
jgi:hypothetical protein